MPLFIRLGPRNRLAACVVAVAAILALGEPASAASVVNGGFESGALAGWTIVNEPGGNGNWFAYSRTRVPPERPRDRGTT